MLGHLGNNCSKKNIAATAWVLIDSKIHLGKYSDIIFRWAGDIDDFEWRKIDSVGQPKRQARRLNEKVMDRKDYKTALFLATDIYRFLGELGKKERFVPHT